MFSFITLIACSGPFNPAVTTSPVIGPDELDISVESTPEAAVQAVHCEPVEMTLTLPDASGYSVQILPYRGEDVVSWSGSPLYSEFVQAESVTITLPTRVPASHRERGEDDVVYAIVLRETDEQGNPSRFLGVSDAQLVWSAATETEDGGWRNVLRYGTENEQILADDEAVSLWPNIQGPPTVELAGFNTIVVPDTHVVLSSCGLAGCVSAFDAPVGPEGFAIQIDGAPDVGPEGAMFALETYLDADGDNRLTTEEASGVGCLGQEAVVLTWYPSAYDLNTALEMKADNTRGGWDVWLDTKDGLVGVAPDYLGNITLAETCEIGQ